MRVIGLGDMLAGCDPNSDIECANAIIQNQAAGIAYRDQVINAPSDWAVLFGEHPWLPWALGAVTLLTLWDINTGGHTKRGSKYVLW